MAQLIKQEFDNVILQSAALKYSNDPVIVKTTPKTVDVFNIFESTVATYTILAKTPSGQKETFNVTVLADKTVANWTVYGRVSIGTSGAPLIDVDVTTSGPNVKLNLTTLIGPKSTVTVTRTYLETF